MSTYSAFVSTDRPLYMPGNPFAFVPGAPPAQAGGIVMLERATAAAESSAPPRNARLAASSHACAMNAWFINQIWLKPQPVDFGPVITPQTRTVSILSTYRSGAVLEAPDAGALGEIAVSIEPPASFPMRFDFMGQHKIDFTAAVEGASSADAPIAFVFDVLTLVVDFLLQRLQLFTFLPDWSTPPRETLSWRTAALVSPTAVSQRRAVRIAPRRSFAAELIVEGSDRVQLDLALHGWRAGAWALPIWPDVQRLGTAVPQGATTVPCSTVGRDFAIGALVVFRGENVNDGEAVEIAAVEADALELAGPTTRAWPAGTRLYPGRVARLMGPAAVTRLSDRAARVGVEFLIAEASDWPAATLAQHRGHGVYDARPDESEELQHSAEWMVKVLDAIAALPHVADPAEAALPVQQHRWVAEGLTERAALRSLLYALRGAQVPVWVPTHSDDVQLAETLPQGEVVMTIAAMRYTRFGLSQSARQNIRVELTDGTVYYRKIVDAEEADDDTEELTLATAFPEAIAPADVARISFMQLSTGEDVIQLEHHGDALGVAVAQMLFTAVRDDDV